MKDQEAKIKIYHALIKAAMKRSYITELDIAKLLKLDLPKKELLETIEPYINRISTHCQNSKLPPLTSLAVYSSGSDKGFPLGNFWNIYGRICVNTSIKFTATLGYQNSVYDLFSKPSL